MCRYVEYTIYIMLIFIMYMDGMEWKLVAHRSSYNIGIEIRNIKHNVRRSEEIGYYKLVSSLSYMAYTES